VCTGKIYELDTGQQCFGMFIPDPTKNKKIKLIFKNIIYHFVTLMNEDKKCQKSIATGG
jgi:hypothetical protein